jgi:hypothetical protein
LQEWQSRLLDLTRSFRRRCPHLLLSITIVSLGSHVSTVTDGWRPPSWRYCLFDHFEGDTFETQWRQLVANPLDGQARTLRRTGPKVHPLSQHQLGTRVDLCTPRLSLHLVFPERLEGFVRYWSSQHTGALYVMFVVRDVCYSPCHKVFHQPWCYPLIHKHHHRQHFPTPGYRDAGSEHPIEHVVGVYSTCGRLSWSQSIGRELMRPPFSFSSIYMPQWPC